MDEQTYQTMQEHIDTLEKKNEAMIQTMKETVDLYEDKLQKLYKKDKNKQDQINALEGKYKGSVRTIQKQNKELDKLRPKKQKGYRNQPKNYRR